MTVVVMPSSGTRLRGIEGLRGIAAFFVLCFHVMLVLRASDQVHAATDVLSSLFAHGLTLFFVLSGFLITRILLTRVGDAGRVGMSSFWAGRLRRLFPAAAVTIVAVAVLAVAAAFLQFRRGSRVAATVMAGIGVLLGVVYFVVDKVPNDFSSMTPYVITLLVLAFASQRLRMPAADGQIYRKGSAG